MYLLFSLVALQILMAPTFAADFPRIRFHEDCLKNCSQGSGCVKLHSDICDGSRSCSEGSSTDESNCQKCQIRCNDLTCISKAWVCDGDIDCIDFSDEAGCTRADYLKQKNSTTCIKPCRHGMCRYKDDLAVCACQADYSGEFCELYDPLRVQILPGRTPLYRFHCDGNRTTLDWHDRCDGLLNCRDKTDEIGCLEKDYRRVFVNVTSKDLCFMPCNHGQCRFNVTSGSAECVCPIHFSGTFCEQLVTIPAPQMTQPTKTTGESSEESTESTPSTCAHENQHSHICMMSSVTMLILGSGLGILITVLIQRIQFFYYGRVPSDVLTMN